MSTAIPEDVKKLFRPELTAEKISKSMWDVSIHGGRKYAYAPLRHAKTIVEEHLERILDARAFVPTVIGDPFLIADIMAVAYNKTDVSASSMSSLNALS